MDCMGGHINPLQLVDSIPAGMAIPRLRDRLCTIIADFRTQQSLREACNVILQHDCLRLAQVAALITKTRVTELWRGL